MDGLFKNLALLVSECILALVGVFLDRIANMTGRGSFAMLAAFLGVPGLIYYAGMCTGTRIRAVKLNLRKHLPRSIFVCLLSVKVRPDFY